MGRKYGIGKYGYSSYDLFGSWAPAPAKPPEVWVPIGPPSGPWAPVPTNPEIWYPQYERPGDSPV